ncbi:MAG: tRNA 2-thiocytidine biosynthesis protein TtcA [Proteobacteria bacterium]|nr:tRNA 2-thiocytidine biosynthesis protein TtcA [Pseudomonadota bacterium]
MNDGYRLPARLNRKIGQAMHDYSMFSAGDNVLVAVSGGVDSLVLSGVLSIWQKKAPIRFNLTAHHIDHGFWRREREMPPPATAIGRQLLQFGFTLEIDAEREINEEARTCFLCARNRRNQLFELARERGYNKIALGHHKDDLIETFFLNAIHSGNISTMVPRQDLFGSSLAIVRPMAYLEKTDVEQIAGELKLQPVKNLCPLSEDTRREKVRSLLQRLYEDEPAAKSSLFSALSNVRREYLL